MRISDRSFYSLLWFRAVAGIRAEASRYYLGFLWWVIEPALYMLAFYVVFGLLLQRGTEDFVPFLLIGIVIWRFFSSIVSHAAASIWSGGRIMTQLRLPTLFFPAVPVVMDAFKFAVVFGLLLLFLWGYGFSPGPAYVALPLVLLVQFTFTLMCALFAAMAVPFLPDIRFVIDSFLQFMFFFSGIFFHGRSLPDEFQRYLYLNPMNNLIDAYRTILMHDRMPDWAPLLWIAVLSTLGMVVAIRLLDRLEQTYPRLVKA